MEGIFKEFTFLQAKYIASSVFNTLQIIENDIQEGIKKLSDGTSENQEETLKLIKEQLRKGVTQLINGQKEIYTSLNRYGKILDKQFKTDLSSIGIHEKIPGNVEELHRLIALHWIRRAEFSLVQTFTKETCLDIPENLLHAFGHLYQILHALKNQEFDAAIKWAYSKREQLEQRSSNLEFDLHKLQFISILTRSDPNRIQVAIEYAKTHFPLFAYKHLQEIKKLMCLFCYASNISLSPYNQIYTHEHLWTSIQTSFNREYCSLVGLLPDSPLQTVSIVGSLAIPTLLKMSSIMKEKKTEWTSENELPVEVPLPSKYRFHSVFTCPVSKEQTTESNPPLMIPCGHVISKKSIERLSKDNPSNKFKCPYCPKETTPQEVILLYF
ncbi:hypothetical protein PNEG_00778 [Pneumocystis murina B123]|uniref:GID complex catalytic subunit 2 n=1 Tax=Pneumocystis murina (strain B123) TaxID=1069680 RepID=M7PBB9_PNEMU|nr:hypothetical protein PNEG_00778 [Pneumocystis murina B123]EMR11185.1 hypothetical protein PNEG_00778 [Pneumocystis murina B123]